MEPRSSESPGSRFSGKGVRFRGVHSWIGKARSQWWMPASWARMSCPFPIQARAHAASFLSSSVDGQRIASYLLMANRHEGRQSGELARDRSRSCRCRRRGEGGRGCGAVGCGRRCRRGALRSTKRRGQRYDEEVDDVEADHAQSTVVGRLCNGHDTVGDEPARRGRECKVPEAQVTDVERALLCRSSGNAPCISQASIANWMKKRRRQREGGIETQAAQTRVAVDPEPRLAGIKLQKTKAVSSPHPCNMAYACRRANVRPSVVFNYGHYSVPTSPRPRSALPFASAACHQLQQRRSAATVVRAADASNAVQCPMSNVQCLSSVL